MHIHKLENDIIGYKNIEGRIKEFEHKIMMLTQ